MGFGGLYKKIIARETHRRVLAEEHAQRPMILQFSISAPTSENAHKPIFWESETVAANRVAAINPYRRHRPDTEIQYRPHADLQNPAEFSPEGKPIRNFSIDPTSSIRTRWRTPFLRTPFPRLLDIPFFQKYKYITCNVTHKKSGELMFGSLHNSYVIHRAPRNYIGKSHFVVCKRGVGHCISKVWGDVIGVIT